MAKTEAQSTPDTPIIIIDWDKGKSTFVSANITPEINGVISPDGTMGTGVGFDIVPAKDVFCNGRRVNGVTTLSKPINRVLRAGDIPMPEDFTTDK